MVLATAPLAADGRVNVPPRGHDSSSVLGTHRVGWVDDTGSGVETIAHLRENGRICVMFASSDRRPRTVRLHGRGTVRLRGAGHGPRGERDLLRLTAEKKGPGGMAAYRAEENSASIDGLPGL